MKNIKHYLKGFTLVELIIVITILAILATIAFVSFQNYTKDARDSSRLTTFSSLSNGFELFYTQVGNYPLPDDAVIYTGGNINIGVIGEKVSKLMRLNSIPKDPLTQKNYVYSVGGNAHYYQIAGEKENVDISSFIIPTYAAGENKIPIVKGNYQLDPSLPSLIPIKESILSGNIFDKNVCFIVDGGGNNFTSTYGNCTKKKDMIFKEFDSSLVGYWDMETCNTVAGDCLLSTDRLKDISGNENAIVFSGGIHGLNAFTGSKLGTGVGLNGTSNFLYIEGSNQTGHILKSQDFTVITQIMIDKDIITWNNNDIIQTGRDWNNGGGYVLRIGRNNNINLLVFNAIGNKTININAGNIEKNKFYNIAIKKEKQSLKVFVNGEIKNNITLGEFVYYDNYPIYFGKDTTWGGSFFSGIIDDMKIYNGAKSDQQIIQQAKISGF